MELTQDYVLGGLWQSQALCKGKGYLFYAPHICWTQCNDGCDEARRDPFRVRRVKMAREVCSGCPVREACLMYADITLEQDGVWGGLTERERQTRRSKMKKEA